jgi:hypothetical protein
MVSRGTLKMGKCWQKIYYSKTKKKEEASSRRKSLLRQKINGRIVLLGRMF